MEFPYLSTARILLAGCDTSTIWQRSPKSSKLFEHAEICTEQYKLPVHATDKAVEPTRLLLGSLPAPPPKRFFAVKWRLLIGRLAANPLEVCSDEGMCSNQPDLHISDVQALVDEPVRFLTVPSRSPPRIALATRWSRAVSNIVEYRQAPGSEERAASNQLYHNLEPRQTALEEPVRLLPEPLPAPPPKIFFATRWRRLVAKLDL